MSRIEKAMVVPLEQLRRAHKKDQQAEENGAECKTALGATHRREARFKAVHRQLIWDKRDGELPSPYLVAFVPTDTTAPLRSLLDGYQAEIRDQPGSHPGRESAIPILFLESWTGADQAG
jgi:hypothetical protein